jgi:hypothetical protein
MNTLVIHPQDPTTDFLTYIYAGKGWDVITTNVSKSYLKHQIKTHERIVMLGHGTEKGLFGFFRMVIDSGFVYLLREKYCVCIWCKASEFADKYGLKGFSTGMIISEYEEAVAYCVNTTDDELLHSNLLFAYSVKQAIDSSDFLSVMKENYNAKGVLSGVMDFNRQNLFYKENAPLDTHNGKEYLNLRIRLRQDSGASAPEYTTDEILEKIVNNKVKFSKGSGGSIFLLDSETTDKIMGVIE